MFTVELTFAGDLIRFLHRHLRAVRPIRRVLSEKTAVKDVVEACGVPHTEVDLIVVSRGGGERAVDLSWPVQSPVYLVMHPVPAPAEVLPGAPRLQARHWTRFVADGHLGKLARNLRLLGFDTVHQGGASDRRLLEIMTGDDRALLTRDRRLLMNSLVRHGYCPRSQDPEEQTCEVLSRFALRDDLSQLSPYSRCLLCNGRLDPVDKAEVAEFLAAEPLTLRYYESFRRCSGCGKIYWSGTHFERLAERVARLIEG